MCHNGDSVSLRECAQSELETENGADERASEGSNTLMYSDRHCAAPRYSVGSCDQVSSLARSCGSGRRGRAGVCCWAGRRVRVRVGEWRVRVGE